MNPKELLDILDVAAKLKIRTRHCYTEDDRKESVADHSWRMALMAMLISHEEEYAKADMNKVIRMCLIHDLGEAFTGDIPTFLKQEADGEREDLIFDKWVASFPQPLREEWQMLLQEMREEKTTEARLYKCLDKMEAVISHNESDIASWLPLEYDLQFSYGARQAEFSAFTRSLKKEVDRQTKEKIKKEAPGHLSERSSVHVRSADEKSSVSE